MMELTTFNYHKNKVRTVTINSEPWFVLKDLCDVLGIDNNRNVSARLDDDEKGVHTIDTPGGVQNAAIVSESAFYKIVMLSRKVEAKQFQRWVTHEVLPSIRRHGSYIKTPQTYIQALESLIESEREKERLAFENTDLKIELDESLQYYTIKRVASINGVSWRSIDWKKLKSASQGMECEVKRIFDANYGNVNSYHVDVWKHEYPYLRYDR